MSVEPTTKPAAAAGTVDLGDLTVNRMGFGAMRITGTGTWGEPADREEAKRLLRRALELGVNLIDTADAYGPEVSEALIAETLYPYPDELVIATKGGLTRPGPGDWLRDGRPEALREALEGSLRRLRLERIDVYQLHSVDSTVPFAESIGALAELQREGKIRHIGLSNVDPRQLSQARSIVEVVSVQNRYNLGDRYSESVIEACERNGIVFLPWFPLDAGALATAGGKVAEVAASHGATPAQIALAWLLRRSPAIAMIPGTSSVEHLEENVGATTVELSEAEFADLSRTSAALL